METGTELPRLSPAKRRIGLALMFTLGPALLAAGQALLFLARTDRDVVGLYVLSAVGMLAMMLLVVGVVGRFSRSEEQGMRRLTVAGLALVALCGVIPVEGVLVHPSPWHVSGLLMILPAAVLLVALSRGRAASRAAIARRDAQLSDASASG